MRKDQQSIPGGVAYLTLVTTPFTTDWILARIILTYLRPRECLTMEEISQAWRGISLQHWQKKLSAAALAKVDKKTSNQPWLWTPPVFRTHLAIDFMKVYCCVDEYIKNHALYALQIAHLRSKNVARDILDGNLTIQQAAVRTQTEPVRQCWIIPRTGIELGIDPAILIKADGSILGFGPFHVKLVEEEDVSPQKIAGLSPEKIKRLPELQGLFKQRELKGAGNLPQHRAMTL